jgi:hypothetical protein
MDEAVRRGDRVKLREIAVDPLRVQASGLVKDIVNLVIPDERGDFSTTLVTQGALKLKTSSERWREYCASEAIADSVIPLMVLQVPNTPNNDQIGAALDAIQAVLPGINSKSVGHVLSEGRIEVFGKWEVPWVQPQRVEERTEIRVLIAKEAISTGWDCPRAEVLVSFRPAKDQTHIAQLLGRMVRSPLARRVPGDDVLNSVDCILPYFDKSTATAVVSYMTGQVEGLPPIGGGRVLIEPRELKPNAKLDARVWSTFAQIPSQTIPRRGAKPITRLMAFAHALSTDGVRINALAQAHQKMHAMLDGLQKIYAEEFESAVQEILTLRLSTISGEFGGDQVSITARSIAADERAIQGAFEESKRVFGRDITKSYLTKLMALDSTGRDYRVDISALASLQNVRQRVDEEAVRLFDEWFSEGRIAIKALSDARREEYDEIRALAIQPQLTDLRSPKNRLEDFATSEEGRVELSPTFDSHLMSDEFGRFPIGSLNSWEREVIKFEMQRSNFVGWYRNPSHNGPDSLSIAYKIDSDSWSTMHPDFIIFSEVEGAIRPSIVDPHGHFLADSLQKLKGLAIFAEQHGDSFMRIDALIYDGDWRVLDLKEPEVRKLLEGHHGSVTELYRSSLATRFS